ncbi:hypothetical protein P8452_12562 [Trifolium repens]|nr:hypothetical protein P8452_12562 [Trifolium repens]
MQTGLITLQLLKIIHQSVKEKSEWSVIYTPRDSTYQSEILLGHCTLMRNSCFHVPFLINVLLLVSYVNASLDVFTSLLLSLKGDLRYKMQRYFNG